jgi:hypothetical protein
MSYKRNGNPNSRRLAGAIMTWMTDPENDEDGIDFGVTPPRGPIVAPKPGSQGGWPTNPTVKPKGTKKRKKPNDFAR